MDSASTSKLDETREQYRKRLATALTDEADPLAAYDAFVHWTLDNYRGDALAHSGVLELLEEATRRFVDDPAYKSDLRYLKLWTTYAAHVEDPTLIYGFILSKDIGVIYAHTYQEYADALEKRGRRKEAVAIYKKGVQSRARPTEALKQRYLEFKARTSPPSSDPSPIAAIWKLAPPAVQALRRNPLKNYQSPSAASSNTDPSHPYAMLSAPPVPGRRPEKLRFNLSLLLTADGKEYCAQEARARSMGLLGKKWGPPPDAKPRVMIEDKAPRQGMRTMTRKFGGVEPTVTLMTKEALADVFGLYNSPEKSVRLGVVGTKHAPVRKVEPITPMQSFRAAVASSSDSHTRDNAKTPMGFKPFVDEGEDKANPTPAPPPKFKPFIDEDEQPKKPPAANPARQALSLKGTASKPDEEPRTLKKLAIPTDARPPPVFSATPKEKRWDVFTDDPNKAGNVLRSSTHGASENGPPKLKPFVDKDVSQPAPVFTRPPPRGENAPAPIFTPFVDKPSAPARPPLFSSASGRPVLGERIPLQRTFTPEEPEVVPNNLNDSEEDEDEYDEPEPADVPLPDQAGDDFEDDSYDDSYAEDPDAPPLVEDHMLYDLDDVTDEFTDRVPKGGRYAPVDIMTPITERTFEFTSSTHIPSATPTSRTGVYRDNDAVVAAEQLAAELREEEEAENEDMLSPIEERTGTLSLADALNVASSFKPPNPCNPFDPPIMSTLLSLIPQEHGFYDLRGEEAGQLEGLQKFAKKKARRTSGNTTSSRLLSGETYQLDLHDRNFSVLDKLGEGGFGAVFEAVDLAESRRKPDDSDEDDEDEDEEENAAVALKVVKPRNLWEYHVLRRIHTTLPASLRRSIVTPEALYAFRDESFLVLELCKQGTLLDIVNRAPAAGISQQGGACLDELLVMFFAIELLRLLSGLHRAGFIHGDVKIDNCLLRIEDVPGPASAWGSVYDAAGAAGWAHKGVKLIDFGRTVDTRLFPAGQRFVADWPTDARDCPEVRDGRPWTFETDYFGLAGIVYCMLYGKYIEAASVVPAQGGARARLATPFKRYWQGELWTRLFDLLLNPTLVRPNGELPVCDELDALRGEMEVWLKANCNRGSNSLKGLLKKVGLAILSGKD